MPANRNIPDLARMAVAAGVNVEFHPLYQGFRSRGEAFRDSSWRPSGGFHVLLVVQDGLIQVTHRGHGTVLESGMAFLLRPDGLPAVHFERGVRYHETYFRLLRGRCEYRCADRLAVRRRAWALSAMIDSLAGSLRDESQIAVSRHWLGLSLAQFHGLPDVADDAERLLSPWQSEAAVRWAREHLHRPADPGAMARAAGLTHAYFARLFRNTFGLAPRDWMAREKAREACRLLEETPLRSQEIAHQLGYESSSSFGRQFRQVVGISPARYRLRTSRVPAAPVGAVRTASPFS